MTDDRQPTLAGSLVGIYRRRWLAGDWRVVPVTLAGLVLVLEYSGERRRNEHWFRHFDD